MGRVIGPISRENWLTMQMLRYAISFLGEKKNPKHDLEIRKDQECLKLLYDEALGSREAA